MYYITAQQLVDYTEAMLGECYWFGTFGQVASEDLYKAKLSQYSEKIGKWPKSTYTAQYGKRVFDCIGLIKGAAGSKGDPNVIPKYSDIKAIDWSADQTIKKCTDVVPFDQIPEIPGQMVWKKGHAGVFIKTLPDGKKLVRESKGHAYGVVETTDTKWEKAGKLPYVDYTSVPVPTPTFKSYKVVILVDALNYRNGPGLKYKINGVIRDKGGIYTIVDEAVDNRGVTWGKLKSGVGWISLRLTKKIK